MNLETISGLNQTLKICLNMLAWNIISISHPFYLYKGKKKRIMETKPFSSCAILLNYMYISYYIRLQLQSWTVFSGMWIIKSSELENSTAFFAAHSLTNTVASNFLPALSLQPTGTCLSIKTLLVQSLQPLGTWRS